MASLSMALIILFHRKYNKYHILYTNIRDKKSWTKKMYLLNTKVIFQCNIQDAFFPICRVFTSVSLYQITNSLASEIMAALDVITSLYVGLLVFLYIT